MFKVLFKKELLENVLNYRFLLALVLCLVIIPLGFAVSQEEYKERRQVYDETVRDYEQAHPTIGYVVRDGGAAFRPPSPLGFLSGGVEMVLPTSVESRAYITDQGAEVQFNNVRRVDNPFTWLFGRLDLTFIVSTVLSVLVMLFAFNAVAGEKERRTLAPIMANSVPRPMVITAKMAAGSALLAASFLAGTLAGVLLTSTLGLSPFSDPATWAPFGIAIGVSLVFLLVFYSFGLLISSLSRSSISALVALLSAWVAFGMVLPKGSVVVAKLLLPIKSQQVIDLQKDQVRFQSSNEFGDAVHKLGETMPGVKDLSSADFSKQWEAKNPAVAAYEKAQLQIKNELKTRLNSELDKIDAEFERQKGYQATLARNLARLSPVSCLVHILAELAGTGFTEENKWQETRSHFKQILDREIANKEWSLLFKFTYFSGFGDIDFKAPAPKFPPETTTLEMRLAAVWVDLVLLGVYGILFFAGAYVAFLRYDVR
jgi:ABC-type transport system involved in multi-copper enzyme maturation permease subunit